MKVVTTREFRSGVKGFFELAEKERVSIKRGNRFVNLIVSDDPDQAFVDQNWVTGFLTIPDTYRCNPFEISPSGDLFWADKRNVEHLRKSIEAAEQEKQAGTISTIKGKEELSKFLDSL
jgi:hypothetical protein